MTTTDPHPLLRTNVVGGVLMIAGFVLLFGPWFFDGFTFWTMTFGVGLAVFGALIIVPGGRTALAAVADAGSKFTPILQTVAERGGRRDTDPVVLTTEPTAVAAPAPAKPAPRPAPPASRPAVPAQLMERDD